MKTNYAAMLAVVLGVAAPLWSSALPALASGGTFDVAITKSHTGNFTAGQTGTFTITLHNTGPGSTGTDILTVTDVLPTGLTYVSDTASAAGLDGCVTSGQTITCAGRPNSGAGIAPGSEATFTLSVAVAVDAPSTLQNTATFSDSFNEDTNAANNSSTDAVTIDAPSATPPAQLGLAPSSLSFGDVPVGSSSGVQQVTITNTGGSGADPLQLGQLAIQGTNAGDFSTSSDLCSNTSVPAGQSCTVGVTLTPTAVGARSANLMVPSNAATSPDQVALSGNGTALVTPSADVRLAMTASTASAPRGAQVTYLITVSNIGPSSAHNVVLSTPVPSGARFLGITTTQGTCMKPSKGKITCSLGDLAKDGNAGSVVSIKLTATVGSSVTNLASAYSTANAAGVATADPNTSNNWASCTVTVTK